MDPVATMDEPSDLLGRLTGLDAAGLAALAARARRSEVPPERQAIDEGLLDERTWLTRAGALHGLDVLDDLSRREPCEQFCRRVPIGFARKHAVLGLRTEGEQVCLVTSDPSLPRSVEDVFALLGRRGPVVLAPRPVVLEAITRAYEARGGAVEEIVQAASDGESLEDVLQADLPADGDLLDIANQAPIVRLVNTILSEAVRHRASDVHLQPSEKALMVRYRVDGILFDRIPIARSMQDAVLSRVKVMGRMDIAERRLPQDGRATVQVGTKTVDLRISSIPTVLGERIVLRLLDKSARLYDLHSLGMDVGTLVRFEELIASPHGIILVTGPTGSGKSTTLYSAIQRLNAQEKNILTIEDPVEYQLPGISQTQTNDRKGMTFATGLRHVLRQDPDIIMVGEIRDQETARMAVQSSLTGHLVFSTLHTNDSASAITRMLDLGIEPYLVASSLIGVLAQRLTRRICPDCRREVPPDEQRLAHLRLPPERRDAVERLWEGAGCEECLRTGYRERIGVFELLRVDEPIREAVLGRSRSDRIKSLARSEGMRTLMEDAIEKVLSGRTTAEEVRRVVQVDC